jgi:hypothetical protein
MEQRKDFHGEKKIMPVFEEEKLKGLEQEFGKPLIYLSSPYSDPDSMVRDKRAMDASRVAGVLMNKGYAIFSPIAHAHSIAFAYSLPTDWQFWENFCRAYLSVSSKMIIVTMPGWDTSGGVDSEIRIAQELKIPIYLIDQQGETMIPWTSMKEIESEVIKECM